MNIGEACNVNHLLDAILGPHAGGPVPSAAQVDSALAALADCANAALSAGWNSDRVRQRIGEVRAAARLAGDAPVTLAAGRADVLAKGGLNVDELIAACRNVGVDLACGGCAAVFYTGTGATHEEGCRGATALAEVEP